MARKRPTHVTNLLTALWTWLKILRMPDRGAGSAGADFSRGSSEARNSAALCATAETWCISRSNVNVSKPVHDRFVNTGEEAGRVVHQFPMQKKGTIPVLRKCPDVEVNGQVLAFRQPAYPYRRCKFPFLHLPPPWRRQAQPEALGTDPRYIPLS